MRNDAYTRTTVETVFPDGEKITHIAETNAWDLDLGGLFAQFEDILRARGFSARDIDDYLGQVDVWDEDDDDDDDDDDYLYDAQDAVDPVDESAVAEDGDNF